MRVHASCAARDRAGVLLIGPPGSGKSDLVLRLLRLGFELVADDQVDLIEGVASAPPALAGLLEVRGLGIVRLAAVDAVRVALVVELGPSVRLPDPAQRFGLPLIRIDPREASAADRIALALRCVLNETELLVGAFV